MKSGKGGGSETEERAPSQRREGVEDLADEAAGFPSDISLFILLFIEFSWSLLFLPAFSLSSSLYIPFIQQSSSFSSRNNNDGVAVSAVVQQMY